jgi:hypothetical protein
MKSMSITKSFYASEVEISDTRMHSQLYGKWGPTTSATAISGRISTGAAMNPWRIDLASHSPSDLT